MADEDKYCGCFDSKTGATVFTWFMIILGIGAVLVAIIVPVASLQSVDQDEIAVTYEEYTKQVSPEIREQGRYVLPLTVVLRYKRTAQTVDMTAGGGGVLLCLTKEGLEMELDITAQYQIIKDDLFSIFNRHGLEAPYRLFLVSLTRDTVKDVCPLFTGVDFFNDRGGIESAIKQRLTMAYVNSTAFATIELVQLRNVKHPDSYEEANRQREETEQEKDRALSARNQQITDVETRLVQAQYDATIRLIAAQATADSNIIAANEQAKVETTKWRELQLQLVNVYSQFNGVPVEQFINEFVRYQVLTGRNQSIYGLK